MTNQSKKSRKRRRNERKRIAAQVAKRLKQPQDLGVSLKFSRGFDIQRQNRLDVLYGWGTLQPDAACTITLDTKDAE